jgi:hypothetical protein
MSCQSHVDVDERPQPQSFLNRPVRSLLDMKIGTVLKGYLVYIAISLVIGVIGLIVLLAAWHHTASNASGLSGDISWAPGAGETVTPAEYRSLRNGARLGAMRGRFGKPATTGSNPFDQVSGATQTCLGYRSSASDSLFLFCFEGGRLVDKQTF